MDYYTDLIARLRENADLDAAEHVPSEVVQMQYDAADTIEALVKELDALKEQHHLRYRMWHDESIKRNELQHELAALRKQIDELQPVAWKHTNHNISSVQINDMASGYYGSNWASTPLYSLDGIKK